MSSASLIAATIAAVLATMTLALAVVLAPGSSASAMARADAVRSSMLELAADSVRNKTDENGAISPPSSASNRVTSRPRPGVGERVDGQVDSQVGDVGANRRLIGTPLVLGRAHICRAGELSHGSVSYLTVVPASGPMQPRYTQLDR